jgi:hypothetical protein
VLNEEGKEESKQDGKRPSVPFCVCVCLCVPVCVCVHIFNYIDELEAHVRCGGGFQSTYLR